MTVTSALARPMLAGIFIYGGIDAVRHPETKAPQAEAVGPPIAERLGLSTDTIQLVKINGGVQIAGGALLAIGKFPRLASLALVGSLVPTTYAGHRFWEETDDLSRSRQQIQFLKNVAVLGGLILAAGDTGGRPSVTWRARRATRRASKASKVAAASTLGAMNAASLAGHGAATAASLAGHGAANAASAATHGAANAASTASHGAAKLTQAATIGAAAGAAELSRRAAKAGRRASSATLDTALDLARDTVDLARDGAAKAREALPVS